MQSFLPSNRFFAAVAAGAILTLELSQALITTIVAPDPLPAVRHGTVAFFTVVSAVFAYSLVPLMVRAFFRLAAKAGALSPTAWTPDSAVTDRVIVGVWSVWSLGVLIAALTFALKSWN